MTKKSDFKPAKGLGSRPMRLEDRWASDPAPRITVPKGKKQRKKK